MAEEADVNFGSAAADFNKEASDVPSTWLDATPSVAAPELRGGSEVGFPEPNCNKTNSQRTCSIFPLRSVMGFERTKQYLSSNS